MTWVKAITPQQLHAEFGLYHGQWMPEMDRCWIREEDGVSVCSRLLRTTWGNVEHVTIVRSSKSNNGMPSFNGEGGFTWAEKQQIKNELFGENRVAIEVFPKTDRLVDTVDVYHLWVFDKKFEMPFGIHPKEYKHAINRGSVPLSESELNHLQEILSRKLPQHQPESVSKLDAIKQLIAEYESHEDIDKGMLWLVDKIKEIVE